MRLRQRGGAHLGSIEQPTDNDDEKNYRHAFLIIEGKKGPGGSPPRHVLCAESDAKRDSWVDILAHYVSGCSTMMHLRRNLPARA